MNNTFHSSRGFLNQSEISLFDGDTGVQSGKKIHTFHDLHDKKAYRDYNTGILTWPFKCNAKLAGPCGLDSSSVTTTKLCETKKLGCKDF